MSSLEVTQLGEICSSHADAAKVRCLIVIVICIISLSRIDLIVKIRHPKIQAKETP